MQLRKFARASQYKRESARECAEYRTLTQKCAGLSWPSNRRPVALARVRAAPVSFAR